MHHAVSLYNCRVSCVVCHVSHTQRHSAWRGYSRGQREVPVDYSGPALYSVRTRRCLSLSHERLRPALQIKILILPNLEVIFFHGKEIGKLGFEGFLALRVLFSSSFD